MCTILRLNVTLDPLEKAAKPPCRAPLTAYFCTTSTANIATNTEKQELEAAEAIARTEAHMRAFVVEYPDDDVRHAGGGKAVGVLKTSEPQPVPKAGEALVRVLRAGVCNTDLELLAG